MSLIGVKERVFPAKKQYHLFADLGLPHQVTVTLYSYPFRHIVLDDFLPAEQYQALSHAFKRVLDSGLSQAPRRDIFSRFDLYDLYAYTPKPTLELPLGFFFSESYIQTLESALRRSLSRDTFLTCHHHQPSPEDNYIHNDYMYEYFVHEPLGNGVNPWYHQCDKRTPSKQGSPRVRAAAVIYYLNNDQQEDQGGETGIFVSKQKDSLVRKISPVNNRLTMFDITPTSFHNYMRCSMPARNSIAQWFYVTEEETLRRFPGTQPGGWGHLHTKKP
ncbi:MAG: 2OG-Fe(II) oxygenase [bacterium]|nr:2OG-Fe(II) oxygenase [bacterium]